MRSKLRFAVHTSVVALSLSWGVAAMAQAVPAKPAAPAAEDDSAAAKDAKEIVVTGSSIKGVAPVGSNLVTIGRDQIDKLGASTVQQILKSVPAVVGLNSPGQGGFGSFDGAGTNAPTIHGLGASASNSTLILLNGHRLPLGGANHALADPNIVPPGMLQRVEVLADGASSVYGSDAVAGVVNFITRRNLNGIEVSAQKGFANKYGTFTAGLVAGKTWDTGSVIFGYSYSKRQNLRAADRAFAVADLSGSGGFNFKDTNCSPASISAAVPSSITLVAGVPTQANTTSVFYSPYTTNSGAFVGASSANSLAGIKGNGQCDFHTSFDLIPSELRNNAMLSIQQDVGDSLHLTGDLVYSRRTNIQNVSRGAASGRTVWASGAPAGNSNNPFVSAAALSSINATRLTAYNNALAAYNTVNPTGPVPAAFVALTSFNVNFDADALLGPGAFIRGIDETYYGRLDAVYDINDKWHANIGMVLGRDISSVENNGQLCDSCFNLALNGKASATIAGIPTTVSQVLTAANAVDVFGGGATSAATLAALTDSRVFQQGNQSITNIYAKIDGELFDLPGGAAKAAVGGEYSKYSIVQDTARPNGLGAASFNSLAFQLNYGRTVKSGYAELYLPLIGPDQNIPGIRRLDVNISGRIDDYSDFGSTSNPKIAANWEVVEGLRLRGNWAKSFVAPALTSHGSNAQGRTGESSFAQFGGPNTIQYALYPDAANIPGCGTVASGATSCVLGGTTGRGGIQLNGGNANLQPQKGTAWSLGIDFNPTFAPGLRISTTYWNNKLRGGITAPQIALVLASPALSQYFKIYPTGATQAQIDAVTTSLPQTSVITGPVYFIYNNQQQNVLNLNVAGIDVDASYRFDTSVGKFTLGAGFTRKTQFDQFFGVTGDKFSVLGTAGFNLTFPSLKYEGRYSFDWEYNGFDASVFVNHTGGYINWGNPVIARTSGATGLPTGGGDQVKAFVTVDTHLSYTFKDIGPVGSVQLYVDASNLLNTPPPFYNTYGLNNAAGYDGTNANPIGRVVTIGFKTKF